jgi:hypothetical protein
VDAWDLLGLHPGAAPAEVRRAFAAAVRAVHPDAGGDEQFAAERLAALVAARDRLLSSEGHVPAARMSLTVPAGRSGLDSLAVVLAHLLARARDSWSATRQRYPAHG